MTGKQLHRIRMNLGIKQIELGSQMCCTSANISHLEKSEGPFSEAAEREVKAALRAIAKQRGIASIKLLSNWEPTNEQDHA